MSFENQLDESSQIKESLESFDWAPQAEPPRDNLDAYRISAQLPAPVHSEAEINAVGADNKDSKGGTSGYLRDMASIAAYALTYQAMEHLIFTTAPAPLKVVTAAVAAGAVSDVAKDGSLDGLENDPGAWVRGAGMAIGAHALQHYLIGAGSNVHLEHAIAIRQAALGSNPAAAEAGWTAFLNPKNVFPSHLTQGSISVSANTELGMLRQSLAVMNYHRNLQGAFAVGTGTTALKIADGDMKVDGVGDAINKAALSSVAFALMSGTLVPLPSNILQNTQWSTYPLFNLRALPASALLWEGQSGTFDPWLPGPKPQDADAEETPSDPQTP